MVASYRTSKESQREPDLARPSTLLIPTCIKRATSARHCEYRYSVPVRAGASATPPLPEPGDPKELELELELVDGGVDHCGRRAASFET